ncbi:hypothetical protein Hypma_012412 [Hypsizygus marmoreus]|uniref:Uncharacterized protein n=1 Tax=Hypsizygus marmoreus TaxID=39966 RepID=A0A369JGL9_HYPMA|nr:hypothetical protein Hypma_012412 [Hypsizygus marmoreus]
MSSELKPTSSYLSSAATQSVEVDESPYIPPDLAQGEPLRTQPILKHNPNPLDVEIALAQSMLHLSDAVTSMMFADNIDRPIAAHERLPIEVLSEIFHSSADPAPIIVPPRLSTTAWSLSQVCSRWRQAAIITREFWEDVKVSLELLEDSDDRQTVMDGVTPLVHNVFSRGTRSVDIILDVKQGTHPGYFAGKGNLLGALISPFAAQFEHISLSSVHHILHLFLESPIISFPALESIAITLDYPKLDFSQMNLDTVLSEMSVFEDAPNLRSVLSKPRSVAP